MVPLFCPSHDDQILFIIDKDLLHPCSFVVFDWSVSPVLLLAQLLFNRCMEFSEILYVFKTQFVDVHI